MTDKTTILNMPPPRWSGKSFWIIIHFWSTPTSTSGTGRPENRRYRLNRPPPTTPSQIRQTHLGTSRIAHGVFPFKSNRKYFRLRLTDPGLIRGFSGADRDNRQNAHFFLKIFKFLYHSVRARETQLFFKAASVFNTEFFSIVSTF